MKYPKLPVTVSTRKALEVALSSDLQLIFVEHHLRACIGSELNQIMACAGFRVLGTPDHRGTLFTRTPAE